MSQKQEPLFKGKHNPNYQDALETSINAQNNAYLDILDDTRSGGETSPSYSVASDTERSEKRASVKVRTGQQSFGKGR